MPNKVIEYRRLEFRAETTDDVVNIEGRGVPYNSPTTIGNWFTEEFAQGAFKESKADDEVVLLAGHEGMPLARNGAGTMSFKEKKDGLYFYASLDMRDPHAQSIAVKIDRGDLTGASVGFYAEEVNWIFNDDENELDKRIIKRGKLVEMSVTPFPAYQDTDVGVRDARKILDSARKEYNFRQVKDTGKHNDLFPYHLYKTRI